MQKLWRRLTVVFFTLALVGVGCIRATETTIDDANIDLNFGAEEETSMNGFPGILEAEQITAKVVRIKTDKGDIVFELYNETSPKAVSNFVSLTNDGFYNGLIFHRREEGFVIQGGDPAGNGTGGPGYTFEDELNDSYTYDRGIVAMANRGPDTNGSQFFIMLTDYPLPKQYTIFGRVLEGMEIVDQIKVGDVMTTVSVEDKVTDGT
ncbi:MAG: peptidylprolyl isomerase [Patescibacteria group bacterium]